MTRMRLARKAGYSKIRYLRTKEEKMGHLFQASILSRTLPDERRADGRAKEAS